MGALFGKKPQQPQVARMPVENDEDAQAAADRQRRAIATRTGRSSTILSRGGTDGGTAAYRNSLLGQAG